MKRRWAMSAVTAAAAVAVLALPACGSSPNAAPTPAAQASSAGGSSPVATSGASAGSGAPGGTGAVSGALDAQSAAWFGAVCSGIAPLIQQVFTVMGSALGGAASSDPATTQQQVVGTLNSMSGTLDQAAKTIGALPPPTMANGPELARKVVDALSAAAPKLKQAATQLGSATVTDAQQLQQAMDSVESTMSTSMSGLSLSQLELDPSVEDAMKTLPACAPLYSFAQSAPATS